MADTTPTAPVAAAAPTAFPEAEFAELIAWLRGTAPTGGTLKVIEDVFTVLKWGAGSFGPPVPAAITAPVAGRALATKSYTIDTNPMVAADTMEQFVKEHQGLGRQADEGAPAAGLFGGGKFLKLILPLLIQILTGVLSGGPTTVGG